MGLMDRIENKLSGSGKHQSEKQAEKEYEQYGTGSQGGKMSGLDNKATGHGTSNNNSTSEYGNNGSGMGGLNQGMSNLNTGNNSNSGTGGSRTHDLRHPIQSSQGKDYGGSDSQAYNSGAQSGVNRDGYGGQDYGSESGGRNKMQANHAMDPYSTKGQNAAYEAAEGGRGPQSSIENQNAIPTAGGRELGNPGESGHHYGRDATVGGGAGAAGLGAYEAEKRHRNKESGNGSRGDGYEKGQQDRNNQSGYSSRDGAYDTGKHGHHRDEGITGDSSRDDKHHYGRDAALGGTGAAGKGAYEAEKHHRHGQSGNDSRDESGAYESGRHHGRHSHHDQSGVDSRNEGLTGGSGRQDQHHYGHDGALAGGAGAAGVGPYEAEKHHGKHGHRGEPDMESRSGGPQPSYGSGYQSGMGGQQASEDAGMAAASHHSHQPGMQGHSYEQPGMTGQQYNQPGMGSQTGGSGQSTSASGLPTEKKLGGAYEAGYRDALAHLEAERQK
ncbi:hypothetical protein LTR85_000766 [Meristemomyces frigidus]|nr:hypothetical protein LTR85_000766 [Meristemomyces frigidus]